MLTSILVAGYFITQDANVQLIAHRGSNCYAEENSLEAFQKATAEGYINEVDIQYTSDGKVVVAHDKEYDGVDINSKTLSYWKGKGFNSLKQVYPAEGKILLDAKDRIDLYEPLEQSIENNFRFQDVYLNTPDEPLAKKFKQEHPKVTTLKLILPQDTVTPENILDRLTYFDGVNISYKHLSQEMSDVLKDAGKIVVSWTYDPTDPYKAYKYGQRSDAIIVDCVKKTHGLIKKYQ